jgi:G6PDH family F420-dependent oxidoreductase
MAEIGLFLSSEEHGPRALLDQATRGEKAGFSSVFISDHFHPWVDEQGESPFVWSVIGAIAAATSQRVTTGVTCPTVRIHPAVIAQAAATSQLLLDGRFALGVGSGEALNEHIGGERWPPVATRLEMLEEAVEVMRELWKGRLTTHHGRHYTVETARIYSCPEEPPPVLVSAFGPAALEVAARIGDGLVTTQPDADMVRQYKEKGGRGNAIAAVKICWAEDEGTARKTAHRLWATECLPGQLNQELALPSHFEQAASIVTEEMVADAVSCGPDPDRHAEAIHRYVEAGFDEVYLNQIGDDQDGFFRFYEKELRRRLGG